MDSKLRKFIQSHVFDRTKPHVYIVSMNTEDNTIKGIHQAIDGELIDSNNRRQPLHYYEIKRIRNANKVTHYIYRTINKIPETLNYVNL
ncbi:asb142 [Agrotis segetum nucleopolyhedrovirus B]|uniref:Asb142 n=1 Tax=Agrotis segetum nucleopolyhedrovirus B TaxID=1580580 RepID=A0A0A7KRC1_9ABAC|nr:asb142 [Agrotis segetum nucleopolyhedrovirus B]AIZ48699.1 asb142 [Agrotis segetum nucleopolyhedrovirus B]